MSLLRNFFIIEIVLTSIVSGNWVFWSNNGHFYYISTNTLYIGDARQACLNLGGYLAEINDFTEHTFVVSLLSATHYWVGLEYYSAVGKWMWTNAQTAVDVSIPWNAMATSSDTGVRYVYHSTNGYGLDGRQSPAYYNYLCEYECSSGCVTSIFVQPTETLFIPQPYTVSCENQITTVENVVTQVVASTVCNTNNYVTQTVMETVVHTVTETINSVSVVNSEIPTQCVSSPSTITVTVTNSVPVASTCVVSTSNQNNTGITTGLSNEEVEEIVNELKLDKKTTSGFRRSLISVDDPRPSARVIGSLGIAIFVIIMVFIIWVDAINVIRFMQENCKRCRYR